MNIVSLLIFNLPIIYLFYTSSSHQCISSLLTPLYNLILSYISSRRRRLHFAGWQWPSVVSWTGIIWPAALRHIPRGSALEWEREQTITAGKRFKRLLVYCKKGSVTPFTTTASYKFKSNQIKSNRMVIVTTVTTATISTVTDLIVDCLIGNPHNFK
jgi:hypothetical protein